MLTTMTLTVLTALAGTPVCQEPGEPDKEKKPDTPTMDWTGVLSEKEFAALHELTGEEAPEPKGETVKVAGTESYLSLPEQEDPAGGIVVVHEWWGLNDHIRHWADRLAADGYVALAVDLYGGKVATDREGALEAMRAVDEDEALATLRAAHRWLKEQQGVERRACIGWCFGGGWSLRLALAAPDLEAAVVYYGRLIDDPERLAAIEAPVLGVFGNRDRGIPPEAVDAWETAMKEAGNEVKVLRYDAPHAFANPSSGRYAREHAAAAWKEVRTFLSEHLGRKPGSSIR